MNKERKTKIEVQGTEITIISTNEKDYISLTDMLKAKDGVFFISDWLRNRNTIEFLGIWEQIYNPDFNYGEFAIIKNILNQSNSIGLDGNLDKKNYSLELSCRQMVDDSIQNLAMKKKIKESKG